MTLLQRALLLAGSSLLLSGHALASDFPDKPIKLVVGFTPGGTTDILARLLATEMARHLGQTVIVENKPGASGTLAAGQVAKAPANGYTLMLTTSSVHGIAPALFRKLPYDTVKDFAPVSLVSKSTMVLLAAPQFQPQSVQQLIAYAKQHPGQINYASSGPGSTFHLAAALFEKQAGIQMTHVPYKGGGSSMPALMGGEIQLAFDNIASTRSLIDGKKVRALAVTSAQRAASLPQVPTLKEAGLPDFVLTSWSGLVAPAGTPAAVIERLNGAAHQALQNPALREKLLAGDTEPQGGSAADFGRFIRAEQAVWGQAVQLSGASAE